MGEFEEKYRFCTSVPIRKESVESVDDPLRQTEFIGGVSDRLFRLPQGGKQRHPKSAEEKIERDCENRSGEDSGRVRLGAGFASACDEALLSGIGEDFFSAVGKYESGEGLVWLV